MKLICDEARQFNNTPAHGRRKPSLQLLVDSRIREWPHKDNVCLVDYYPEWKFKDWIAALCAEMVCITCDTVVLYLEKSEEIQEVPPLKNALQHKPGERIFISNMLTKVSSSPLRRSVDSGFTLLQAIRSVNRVLHRVHYLSIFEHFFSKGRIIKPTHQFFREDGHLTTYGCLIFRECILGESGLKPYWF